MTLPNGWRSATLGDVARWGSGGTPKAGTSDYYGGDIPWAVIGDLSDGLVGATANHITAAGLAASSAKRVPAGAVLVAMYGSIGKLGLTTSELTTNQAIAFAVPDPEVVEARFLFYYLLSQREALSAAGKGATQRNIGQGTLKPWPIPLPPLAEQRRIVEILEDHLSRLDAADVELVRARQRTRALELAFVSTLLREEAATRKPLAELLDLSIGGVWGAEAGEDERDVDVLRVTELRTRGRLDPSTSARRSVTVKVLASRQLEPGDLLLEKSGGGPKQPVGRVGMVGELRGPSVCSNFMQLMRPRRSVVEPGFLHLYLNALHESGGTAHMQRASTNIRNIKASEYVQVPVPVPALEEQRRWLSSSLAAAAEVDRLRAALEVSRARSGGLRRALLAAVFSGQLTTLTTTEQIEEMAGV